MRTPRALLVPILTYLVAALAVAQVEEPPANGAENPATPLVTVLDVDGPIGPATSSYIQRGIEAAEAARSQLVVLRMDTPGGLDTSMRDIIRAILASKVPIATFVSPSGSRAASAGTYILYASHVAAMAPATNLGAATPVSIGGEPQPSPSPGRESPRGDEGQGGGGQGARDGSAEDRQTDGQGAVREPSSSPNAQRPRDSQPERNLPGTAMERKVVNDAVAYIRGLAELRGRNVEWAEQAVRTAASLSATAALDMNVIDVIARDVPDLLEQIHGRKVRVGNETITLATANAAIERIEPDWRTKLLSVITNPTVAYGLMLIGIYGLLLEGYNPGALVPGVVGAISLLLALFAFQILSVNYAGLALIGLGVIMIIAEVFMPSFGALGFGGLIAFVVGSIMLLDSDIPGLDIAMPVIGAIATAGGLALLGLVYLASRSIRRPVTTGMASMVGSTAEAFEDFTETGRVRYGGELWNAHTSAPLRTGQRVRIVKMEGLWLWVEPL